MLHLHKRKAHFIHDSSRRNTKKRRLSGVWIVVLVFFVGLSVAVTSGTAFDSADQEAVTNSQQIESSIEPAEKVNADVPDMFSGHDKSLYDESTNTYSFSAADYNSLFKDTTLSDSGNGLRSGTYQSGGKTWNIYCYSTLNSCSVSTSSGTYGNVSCYNTINSCSYSDNKGNYSNTYCYEYTNSCSTTGSNGYTSNTQCYEYTNSCSTRSSNGDFSSTYCYQYTNSCTTNNSDGSTTNTYCYQYANSCSSSTYGGSSSYNRYNSYGSSNSYGSYGGYDY